MRIAVGTVLVLVTWTIAIGALVSVGLLPALALDATRRKARVLRASMWWGLLVVTVFAYLANLAWPLASAQTAITGIAVLAALGIPGWLLWIRLVPAPNGSYRPVSDRRSDRRLVGNSLLWFALGASLVYLAAAALGPVTNFDSGLYHLGAVRYAAQYPTIPGLANLYFPFGYGNAEFPLAAVLGNGPWGGEGFRLLNGLLLTLTVVDLGLRMRARRLSAGTFVLLVGVLAAWVPMVALSDYWVTSPTQDSAVFVLTLVAIAYLVDAIAGGRRWVADAVTAMVLAMLLVLFRPTMAVFAGSIVVVIGVLARRRRRGFGDAGLARAVALVAAAAVIAGVAATLRDVRLSGWLQYPLSVFAFDVPWVASDPYYNRIATLGYHRDPSDLWNAAEGWGWVDAWLMRVPTQWETYQFLAMVAVAVVLVVIVRRSTVRGVLDHPGWRAMALAMAPILASLVFWWTASPPSFRFAWGLMFGLPAIPIGWSLWLLASRQRATTSAGHRWQVLTAAGVGLPILLVVAFSALVRFDRAAIVDQRTWAIGIPYAVAAVPETPVAKRTLPTGLAIVSPTQSNQCWATWPMCTPIIEDTVRLRSSDLRNGFSTD